MSTAPLVISDVALVAASFSLRKRGLAGWLSLTINGALRVDGVCLRQTADGRATLSFPSRRDGAGRDHPILRPLDDEARRQIEAEVFRALGLVDGEVPR